MKWQRKWQKEAKNNFFKQGDIVYCDLGQGASSEQSGIRPCIILQNDVGNRYSPTTLIAPISSKVKLNKNGRLQPTHFIIENYQEVGLKSRSMILFEQIRTISKERILDRKPIGHLDIDKIKNHILVAFGLQTTTTK